MTAGLTGRRVHAYRNLARAGLGRPAVWSVRTAGRVVAHVERLLLADATFRVQPAGRARTRRTGHRNVHAYVAGAVVDAVPDLGWVPVRYDPFGPATFTDSDSRPVTAARYVRLGPDGCYALV